MKTASVQHINTMTPNRIYTSYTIDFSILNNIYTAIMKKLTNVSPFLLLLVPVFIMMVFTITTSLRTDNQAALTMKAKPAMELAAASAQTVK